MSWRRLNFDFRWSGRAIESRAGNVPDLDPGRVNCRDMRARCMNFFSSKIYEIPRAAAARAWCASFVPLKLTVQYTAVSTAVQGGFDTKGYLRRRITAILSIFNFSTKFLAQIEENRWGRLSGPFLGPGDNFSKSYDENQIRSERQRVRTRRTGGFKSRSPASSNPWVRAACALLLRPDLVFVITFRKIIPMTQTMV